MGWKPRASRLPAEVCPSGLPLWLRTVGVRALTWTPDRLRGDSPPPPQVFDFKLRHMRDDIAAIEASNDTLERQSRHNAALLAALSK